MLEIRNLTIAFPTADKPLLMVKNFSLRVEEQAKTILLGESGSGKSLVLLAILRLLPAEAQCTGEILFRGRDIGRMDAKALQSLRGRQIAYIPQGAGNSLNPLTRIGLQVTEGLPLAAGDEAAGSDCHGAGEKRLPDAGGRADEGTGSEPDSYRHRGVSKTANAGGTLCDA